MTKYPEFPTKVSDIPNSEFFAILFPESTTIPGDERSRTNPGHGYPEHTVHFWKMEIYPNREDWEAEIIRLENQTGYAKRQYKAIRGIPANVEKRVSVSVT